LLFAAHQPFSRQSEALRTLRSQLMFRWFNDKRKSIAVTASRSGEGASCLAANLAIVFAQLGERTLLIDANLRNPSQQYLFGLASVPGLSNLLSGRCDADDVFNPIRPFDNLSVLCAGAAPPNPQELLSQIAFSYLVETAPACYDAVIIDTPPTLEYADAQVVSALVGGCVLATHRHQTRLADIEQVRRQLEPSGAQMVGAVIYE
jgi:chain length determinant protein tyrosine kinase EpsG